MIDRNEAIKFVKAIKKAGRDFPEGVNQLMMFGEETIVRYAFIELEKTSKTSTNKIRKNKEIPRGC